MKSYVTTNRRWQNPMSNMWELEIDGKRTGRIFKFTNDTGEEFTWEYVNELFGSGIDDAKNSTESNKSINSTKSHRPENYHNKSMGISGDSNNSKITCGITKEGTELVMAHQCGGITDVHEHSAEIQVLHHYIRWEWDYGEDSYELIPVRNRREAEDIIRSFDRYPLGVRSTIRNVQLIESIEIIKSSIDLPFN